MLAFVSPHAPEVASLRTNQRNVPAYSAPESCTAALGVMVRRSQWKESVAPFTGNGRVRTDDFRAGSLEGPEAKQLFARFDIPAVREVVGRCNG